MSPETPSPPAPTNHEAVVANHEAAMADPAYWDGRDPKHKDAVRRVLTLGDQRYPRDLVPTPGVSAPTPPAPVRTLEESAAALRYAVQAESLAREWLADRAHALNNRNDPHHADAVRHYNELISVARAKGTASRTQLADAIFQNARTSRRPTT
jgi:hypothetical protein